MDLKYLPKSAIFVSAALRLYSTSIYGTSSLGVLVPCLSLLKYNFSKVVNGQKTFISGGMHAVSRLQLLDNSLGF